MIQVLRNSVAGLLAMAGLTAFAVSSSDYGKHFTVTAAAGSGEGSFENFPVLVRLSTAIQGFSYSDLAADGSDLLFTDDAGTIIPHEIDTWNPSGTSLVWVKVPVLASGSVLHCYYSGPSSADTVSPSSTWSDYAGVWHMGDADATGVSKDSTSHGLDGVNGASTSSYADGAIGAGRTIYYDKWGTATTYGQGIVIPYDAALNVGSTFTISGWFYHASGGLYYDYLYERKDSYTVKIADNSKWSLSLAGGNGVECKSAALTTFSGSKESWVKCDIVWDAESGKSLVYLNGKLEGDPSRWGTKNNAADSENPLCIGAPIASTVESPSRSTWNGRVDEVRLSAGMKSAEWIAAEYAMETNPELLAYSAVSDMGSKLALVVATSPAGLGTPTPAVGSYNAGETPAMISSGRYAFLNGVCHACTKYTLETSDDNGVSWSAPVEHEGHELAYAESATAQRVTWIWEPAAVAVQVKGSHSTAVTTYSVEPYAVDAEGVGYFATGVTVTATVTDAFATGFRQWVWVSEGGVTNGTAVSFTVGETPISGTAVFTHGWTAYEEDSVVKLTDGAWVFRATVPKGTADFALSEVLEAAPSGILEIPASLADDDRTIVQLGDKLFENSTALRLLYLPETPLKFDGKVFGGCTTLERVEPFLPSTVTFGGYSGYCFSGCANLTGDLSLANPAQTSFTAARNFQGTRITSVAAPYLTRILEFDFQNCPNLTNVVLSADLTQIDRSAFASNPNLTTVTPCLPDTLMTLGTSAFEACPKLGGTLTLKALTAVPEKAFNQTAFTAVEAPSATSVEKYGFVASSTLASVTFGRESLSLNAYNFLGLKGGAAVYFPDRAPTGPFGQAALSWSNYQVTVYCDPTMDTDGWAAFCSNSDWFRPATAEEQARSDYPGVKTLGVLTAPNGLYWLVAYKSPYRPKGTIVIVR